jgi:hypothetical protein
VLRLPTTVEVSDPLHITPPPKSRNIAEAFYTHW